MTTTTATKACSKLLLYALSKLDEEDQQSFELHLMECDTCFEDLKALERTGDVLHRVVEQHPPELEQALSILKRKRRSVTMAGVLLFAASIVGALLIGRYVLPA